MAIDYGYFDGVTQDLDLLVDAISSLATNGVLINKEDELQVYCEESSMEVIIRTGRAHINGHVFISDEEETKLLPVSDPENDRIDSIVLRLDKPNKKITIEVLKGIASSNPVPKELTQNEEIYEIPLVDVLIIAGRSFVTNNQITDRREFAGHKQELVKPGTIMMWAGTFDKIPEGWALCDGQKGTPDLSDVFLLADNNNSHEYGGSETHTLTLEQMPAHSHTGTTNSVSHSHSGTTNATGTHKHTISASTNDYGRGPYPCMYDGDTVGTERSMYEAGSHSHSISTTSEGEHTHTGLTINSTGGGIPFNIMPKYYKLAYIMKV